VSCVLWGSLVIFFVNWVSWQGFSSFGTSEGVNFNACKGEWKGIKCMIKGFLDRM